MLRSNSLRILLVCTWLLLSEAALAVDPNGVWYGPAATKITVVATPDQLFVTISNARGQIGPLSGKWNSLGERFSFQHNNWTYSAAIRGQSHIDVFNPNGSTSVWKRGLLQGAGANMKSAARSVAIARMWYATAETPVRFASRGGQDSATLVNAAGKRAAGGDRWLRPGQTFDYALPGYPGMAAGKAYNANRITVALGETPSARTR